MTETLQTKYLSLFSGIGGFELGIEQAHENTKIRLIQQEISRPNDSGDSESGGRYTEPHCIGFSEIDKYAIATYQQHYPEHHNYGDITRINTDELPDFDLLVGGFPCQAFSIAGKRKGFEDTRGTLFFEIARILKAKQPRLFCLENVKGLLSHDNGNTFRTIVSTLNELGYDLQWQVLNSKNHGVPQNRERIFIVGHLRGTRRPEVFPIFGTDSKSIKVSGILDTETWRKRHEQIRRVHDTDGISPTLPTGTGGGVMTKVEIKAVLTPDRLNKRQNGRRIKEDGEPSFTLTGQDRHGIYSKTVRAGGRGSPHGSKQNWDSYEVEGGVIRRLTPTECERLQGFPDGWTEGVSDTQRYKTLGNAVTVNVIKAIMMKLL